MQIDDTNSGVQGWINDLKALEKDPHNAFKDRLDNAVDKTCEAIRAVVPKRTGALAASGRWSSRMEGDAYEASIEFGGPPDYAVYVIGQHVNGRHSWDDAWDAGQALIAAEIIEEFPSLSERKL